MSDKEEIKLKKQLEIEMNEVEMELNLPKNKPINPNYLGWIMFRSKFLHLTEDGWKVKTSSLCEESILGLTKYKDYLNE